MKTKTQAIQEFLSKQEIALPLYNPAMEVQVNVIPGEEKVEGKGLRWRNNEHEWSSFRIPYGGSGVDAEPYYNDEILSWPLEKYVEGIGCTGWDWQNRQSLYVGFDFDSIVNHRQGLTEVELDDLRLRVKEVSYITLRRSKSGKGYHLYIEFETPVFTRNHTEHAALAKSILSHLSGLLNFDFDSKVDAAGGNLWIWHRDASFKKRSFETVKKATEKLSYVPDNWKDFLNTHRTLKRGKLDDLISKTRREKLDPEHRTLLAWLSDQQTTAWWNAEKHMLVCHTAILKRAHKELELKGVFETIATGKDIYDHNCFAFPDSYGSWRVYRYTPGCEEHSYWSTTPSGWTTTYFNRHPDLHTASQMFNAKKTAKGKYIFSRLELAIKALQILGANIPTPKDFEDREATLAPGKSESEIVISFEYDKNDRSLADWYTDGRPKRWEKVVLTEVEVREVEPPDEIVRHVVTSGGSKWFAWSRKEWAEKNIGDIKLALSALKYSKPAIEELLGKAVLEAWKEVVDPFGPLYPGDRMWNRNAPQLAYEPAAGRWPTWKLVLDHLGTNIDTAQSNWCIENNIYSGSDYLKLWIASMLRHPFEPLPYLFFYSRPQNTGKSIFHEMIQLLFKDGVGYTRADHALTNPSGFNGELHGAVLCAVEEVDLRSSKYAVERIKDWVTGRQIWIRPLHVNGFNAPNTTHWVQMSNDENHCPVLPGDTRIVVIPVNTLEKEIPKNELIARLQNEAPYFTHEILNCTIPQSDSRLRIPVIESDIKSDMQDANRNMLMTFIEECCAVENGWITSFDMFMSEFHGWLSEQSERVYWSYDRVKKEMPTGIFTRGDYARKLSLGNCRINDDVSRHVSTQKIVRKQRKLYAEG